MSYHQSALFRIVFHPFHVNRFSLLKHLDNVPFTHCVFRRIVENNRRFL